MSDGAIIGGYAAIAAGIALGGVYYSNRTPAVKYPWSRADYEFFAVLWGICWLPAIVCGAIALPFWLAVHLIRRVGNNARVERLAKESALAEVDRMLTESRHSSFSDGMRDDDDA